MTTDAPATPTLHDVVVVGGGLVGASLAIALDRVGVDVALVEPTPAGALPEVFDQRNLSFADATVNALSALGVMRLLRAPPGPIRAIHVSRRGDFGRVRLSAADYGREAFGQVVVARDLGEALEARLDQCRRVVRYRPARFAGLDDADGSEDARVLRIADAAGERRIAARLLVAADGTRSAVRAALGIGVAEHDYAQTLVVARVRAERAPDGTAYERFGADGPTALLPRGDRHFGAIHAVAAHEVAQVAALDDAAFLERLQDAFGWRVGRFLSCGPRSTHAALRVVAERLVAPRAMLVGNAAQTLHPIGAQGFNLGLRDALTLAEMIEAEGIAAAGADLPARYAQRRHEDRQRTLAFSDGLARMTSNGSGAAATLRALGYAAVDRLPALQARLVGGAMGYRGDVPALCRSQAR
jgi:2-octaprenyl-6-methoxyphenol hydroxylase